MNQRVTIEIPEVIYDKVKIIADKIGIPVSSLISLMVENTLMNIEIHPIKEKRRKYKNIVKTHIGFEKDYYNNVILKKIEEEHRYTIKDLILDCIDTQLNSFSAILETPTPECAKNHRITNTKSDKYTKATMTKHNKINAIDEYIKKKSETYGMKPATIEKYFLAQKVNEIIRNNTFERSIFSNPNDFI